MIKIPEGATHYFAETGIKNYRKKIRGHWCAYADGDWVEVGAAWDDRYYHPIQAEPEWSGEGLPPVGMVCEMNNDTWEICTVIAHGIDESKPHAVAQCASGIWMEVAGEFRTLRTPEQIAAEKRDAAIKEMQRLVGSCNTFPFAELYDYGYRLQVEK